MKKTLIKILVIIIFSSCETFVDIEVPPVEQKPVLNCLFTYNKPFKVRLSMSMDVNDTSETKIEAAQISLFANGEFIEELADSGKGFYKSNYLAEVNTRYRIEANITGFETLIASDSLPEEVEINNIYIEDKAIVDVHGNSYPETTVTIKDPLNIKNYYEVYLYLQIKNPYLGYTHVPPGTDTVSPTFFMQNISFWLIDDPVLLSEFISGQSGSLSFADNLFDGKNYALGIPSETIGNQSSEPKHFLIFNTVSKNYYEYKRKIDPHLFNQGGWMYDEMMLIDGGNPVEMYSNVENGYGIFAGYISQVIQVTDIRE